MRDVWRHDPASGWSMSQMYALIVGLVLIALGGLGFAADSSFGTGATVQGSVMAGFEVNGWHNSVHLLSGIVAVAVCRSEPAARLFALLFGAFYGVITVWGFIAGNHVLWLIPVNLADNLLHLAIATLGITAVLVDVARADARRVL